MTPIPFIDLAAQQKRLRGEIESRLHAVLDHGRYVMGHEVEEFETALGAFCGARHVVSCSSGTDALLLGLMALMAREGNKGARKKGVIIPSFTFAATAEVPAYMGAVPVFADIDPASFNLDPAGLEAALATAADTGVEVAGIIPVGLFGQPADMDAINAFAHAHGLWVMDDAAQSLGGTWGGKQAGSLAAITATSFFPAKPLGCYGDGGAVLTDDDGMAAHMRSLRLHGQGASRYTHDHIGMTARLDTMQAAILLAKLGIFADELEKRQAVAARYSEKITSLSGGAITPPQIRDGATSSWAQYCLLLPPATGRDKVQAALTAMGIPSQVYYPKGMHEQKPYKAFPVAGGTLPVTAETCARILALPMHPYLEEETQERIIVGLVEAVG